MIKLFKNLSYKELILFLISMCFIICSIYLELKMPDYMSKITMLVQTEGSSMKEILTNGGYMLLCAFGGLVCSIINGFIVARITAVFSLKTREKLFKKVLDLGLSDVKEFKTSSLITRTTNDITQIEMLLGMGAVLLVRAPITAFWAISKILNKSIEWSLATLVAVAFLLTLLGILVSIVLPRFKLVQKAIDKLNNVSRENLNGIRVIRAFNAEKYQEDKFNDVNDELTGLQMFNQKVFAIMGPVMYLTMNGLTLTIYTIGAFLINKSIYFDRLTLFSDMVVFSSYAIQVIISFLLLAAIFVMLPRANVSAKRILEVLDKKKDIVDGKISKLKEEGTISFKNVYFKYPDAEEYVLEDISFDVKKGETVAFIGSTGSGKSTLINLIPRFYDVTEGEVLVGGVNVKDLKLESLYNVLGYVPQKAVMFDGSVRENVSYGKNGKGRKSNSLIEDAIKVAQAKEFVSKMDDGVDSHIAQGGTNISGGQKQRLAIARAIAREAQIYIFDDSFSALDYKTDAVLRKELKKYAKDATMVIVAQRIGTVLDADKIVVLDQGKCAGIGTHKELLKSCEVYKEIALSQLSKEELENV